MDIPSLQTHPKKHHRRSNSQPRIVIYRRAVVLAEISVDATMDLMKRDMIEKFVEHITLCDN